MVDTQVGEVTELAGGVVQVLKQAQERVLEERRCDAPKNESPPFVVAIPVSIF